MQEVISKMQRIYPEHKVSYIDVFNPNEKKVMEDTISNKIPDNIFIIDNKEYIEKYISNCLILVIIWNKENKWYNIFPLSNIEVMTDKNIRRMSDALQGDCNICLSKVSIDNVVLCSTCNFSGCLNCVNEYFKHSYIGMNDIIRRQSIIKCPVCRSKIGETIFN